MSLIQKNAALFRQRRRRLPDFSKSILKTLTKNMVRSINYNRICTFAKMSIEWDIIVKSVKCESVPWHSKFGTNRLRYWPVPFLLFEYWTLKLGLQLWLWYAGSLTIQSNEKSFDLVASANQQTCLPGGGSKTYWNCGTKPHSPVTQTNNARANGIDLLNKSDLCIYIQYSKLV